VKRRETARRASFASHHSQSSSCKWLHLDSTTATCPSTTRRRLLTSRRQRCSNAGASPKQCLSNEATSSHAGDLRYIKMLFLPFPTHLQPPQRPILTVRCFARSSPAADPPSPTLPGPSSSSKRCRIQRRKTTDRKCGAAGLQRPTGAARRLMLLLSCCTSRSSRSQRKEETLGQTCGTGGQRSGWRKRKPASESAREVEAALGEKGEG
jgi:hypothetical protein